jgi:transposase
LSISTSEARKSEPHVKAARARWGPERVLRLDQLDADERRLVQALLDAKRSADAKKAAPNAHGTALEEDRVRARSTPTS